MAMISPFKDYEVTNSLMELSHMYYHTKCEYESLERDIKHKKERLNAIEDRMKSIVANKEEWEINLDNYKSYNSNYSVIGFVETLLNTFNEKEVIEYIVNTLKLAEKDSRYTKAYWEKELEKGTYSIK